MEVIRTVFQFLMSAIPLGMTFLYGSTGEIITEKSGHLNLGIPGIMCMGAAGGCTVLELLMISSGNAKLPAVLVVIIGILAAFLTAAAMGALYCFLTVTLRANQNVTGLTMTIFGVGTMEYIFAGLTKSKYLFALGFFRYPFAQAKPGTIMHDMRYCGVMVFLAIIIAVVTSIVLNKTKVGLHLRAVGENPATADAVGINVTRYKYIATCIGSGIAGLGGFYYVMDYAGSPESYLSIEPLGWLSIALVIFALWKPTLSIVGSIVFGCLYIAGSYLPSIRALQLEMSTTPLLKMLPYAVTIIVLIISSIRNKRENQPPAGLGVNYFREER